MNPYVALCIAIVCEVIATTALKASDGFSNMIAGVASLALYGVSFYFLAIVLKTVPVGIAYAIWSGAGIVLISAAGWAIYGQKLDAPAIAGMGLIFAGVMVINLFSATAGH